MKQILVATDFSKTAFQALSYAAEMAKQYDAKILLVHANDLSNVEGAVLLGGNAKELAEQQAAEKFHQLLHDIQVIHQFDNIETQFHVGEILDVLSEMVQSNDIWLTIMGTTGTSKSGVFWGSKSLKAMREHPGNILLIPESARYAAIDKALLSVDIEHIDNSFPAAQITNMASELKLGIDVLYVNRTDRTQVPMDQVPGLESIVHRMVISTEKSLSTAIQNTLESNVYDVLMVLPKKYNVWESLFHVSKSEIIAKASHIPVLAIH